RGSGWSDSRISNAGRPRSGRRDAPYSFAPRWSTRMPTVTYGGKQGTSFQLEVDDNLLAVRTRSGRSFLAGPVARREAALFEDMDRVAAFPVAGVEVYRQYEAATPPDEVR